MWERGLKPHDNQSFLLYLHVAPHVGAWIETPVREQNFPREEVAPHVGAWIETICFV